MLALFLAGCVRVPLYAPTVGVNPETVGFGGVISVRLFGSRLKAYRFMGAKRGPDGVWQVRLDPLETLGFSDAEITIAEGDVLPLGPLPAVNVRFERIGPTEITVKPVGIYSLQDQY